MWPALQIEQADDLVEAFLIDFDLAAIHDSRFFFHAAEDRDRAAEALRAHFAGIDVRSVDIPDEDWAARSQATLRAITVGALTIAPPWDAKPNDIIIQPSMGFGTGHHATTRLCVAALQQLDLRGKSVIDVGTGSGVLAIAARRLGASGVLAIDDDADAIAAAEENVTLNQESRIALEVADLRASKIGQFDVVIANLTGALLISAAFRLQPLARADGVLVLSGLMDSEEQDVLRAFDRVTLDWRTQEDEWVCLILATPGQVGLLLTM